MSAPSPAPTPPSPLSKKMQGVMAKALRRSATVVQKPAVAPDTGAAASGGIAPVVTPEALADLIACLRDWPDMCQQYSERAADVIEFLAARSAGAGTPGPAGTGEVAETCELCEGRKVVTELPSAVRVSCPWCDGSGRSPTTRPERQNNE